MILLSKHTLKLVKLITRTKPYSEYFFNFKSSFGKASIFEGNIFTLIFLLNVHNSIRITCRLSEKNSINHWSTITKRYLLHPNTSHYNLLYLLSIYTIAPIRYYENENVEFDKKKETSFYNSHSFHRGYRQTEFVSSLRVWSTEGRSREGRKSEESVNFGEKTAHWWIVYRVPERSLFLSLERAPFVGSWSSTPP